MVVILPSPGLTLGVPADPPVPIVKLMTWLLVAGMVIFCRTPEPPPPPPFHGLDILGPVDTAPPPPPPMASITSVVTLDGTV